MRALGLALALVFLTLATAALVSSCSGPASPAPDPPDLSGTWLLNPQLSEDPREELRQDRDARDRLPGGNRARVEPWEGSPLLGSRVFRIEQTDSTVTVVTPEGSPVVFYVDGRPVEGKIEGLGEVRTLARWKGEKLEVERRFSGDAKITTTYQLTDEGQQIEVKTKLSGFVRSFDFRQVYDAVQGRG